MIHFTKVDDKTYEGEYHGRKIKISKINGSDWQIYLDGTPTFIKFEREEQCESYVMKTIKKLERTN